MSTRIKWHGLNILFYVMLLLIIDINCAAAEQRVALVIGNGNYKSSPLANPPNDARDMAAALQECGFKVTKLINCSRKDMNAAIRTFGEQIRQGGVGLFYYAGHGVEAKGDNFLVPVGVDLKNEYEMEDECINARRVLGAMEEAGNRLNIMILDACRDNPFARSFRSATRGLAKMDAPAGTFIAYATKPGSVAADGAGRNGLYTAKLLRYMRTPDLPIEEVFKNVRAEVMQVTGKQQVPWEASSITGKFVFLASSGGIVVESPAPATEAQTQSGSLKVSANVSKARVYVDGQKKGSTPVSLMGIEPGTHQVKVVKDGYQDYEDSVLVSAGKELEVRALLEKKISGGGIAVSGTPKGAKVYIDGAYAGKLPLQVDSLTAGQHSVE